MCCHRLMCAVISARPVPPRVGRNVPLTKIRQLLRVSIDRNLTAQMASPLTRGAWGRQDCDGKPPSSSLTSMGQPAVPGMESSGLVGAVAQSSPKSEPVEKPDDLPALDFEGFPIPPKDATSNQIGN